MRFRITPRRPAPAAHVDPDPLRSPDDAFETGLIIGATGNQRTPWFGLAIKNLRDRRLATGDDDLPTGGRAGNATGIRAGSPPRDD